MSQQVIICVDDEVIVVESLREQLQQSFGNEYLIEIAESGDEALELFDELKEDNFEIPVVIADFIMPNMKGDDFLEKIHHKDPITKKIMLTGQASIEGVSKAVNKANLYHFISKPWDKNDLLLTIKEAINSYNQAKTIVRKNKELIELNANLEHKVEQRTKELKELNATKDKFFSIIAHDLKNPFNTLIGFTELLMVNFQQLTSNQIHEYISILFDTSRSSYTLLENLLTWSRSQTGRLTKQPEYIGLKELVYNTFCLLQPIARKKGVDLTDKIEESMTAFADYNMITTVIRNLISNAIKYTKKGGKIVVGCKQVQDNLQLSVIDNGIGIRKEIINKLFRIDEEVSTKGTNDESGTGLGLVLCKEFVEENNGNIWVESIEGKGSSFIFTLPLNKPQNNV